MATKNTSKGEDAKTTGKAKKPRKRLIAKTTGKPSVHDRVHGIADRPFAGSAIPKKVKPVKPFKKHDADTTSAERTANGQVRIQWNGHSLVRLVRWMGAEGSNAKHAGEWMSALGYPNLSPVMLQCQVTPGRQAAANGTLPDTFRGPVAELTAEQAKYLRSIMPPMEGLEVEDDDE